MSKKKEDLHCIIISNKVLHNKKLTKGAKLIYIEIVNECGKHGYCKLTNAYFSKCFNTSETSISKWIKELKDNKVIKHSCKFMQEQNKNIRTIHIVGIEENKLKNTFKKTLRTPLSKVNNISKDINSDINSNIDIAVSNSFSENKDKKIKDDFNIKTKTWKNKKGQITGEDIFEDEDY